MRIKGYQFIGFYQTFIYILLIVVPLFISCQKEEKISFNRQIRPILNKNCLGCHGGVKQSGGLGLVFRENALKKTKSGKWGILPGDPGKSEVMHRLRHADPEMRMPLDAPPLNEEEISLIEQWIEQGAEWEEHWAYIKPERQNPPETTDPWISNDIDKFILRKLKEKGLSTSEKASPDVLMRRLSIDLTGLPPTDQLIERFTANPSDSLYEVIVDEMLASPKYGEHWASMWLDLARYADSKGYEKDRPRIIWPYRDWVIKAFNRDMPFDQFTIEQLAGDLLPGATPDQLIATAFHRNTVSNDEGGTDNEEFRIASLIDRVNTTWEVWQSVTMSCVQCHSHPYDPFRHREYFQSLAFFNNTTDADLPHDRPVFRALKTEEADKLKEIRDWIEKAGSEKMAEKWERLITTNEPVIRPSGFAETHEVTHHNRGDQDFMQVFDEGYIKLENIDLSKAGHIFVHYRPGSDKGGNIEIRQRALDGPVIGNINLNNTGKRAFQWAGSAIRAAENNVTDLYFIFKDSQKDLVCYLDGFLVAPAIPDTGNDQKNMLHQITALFNAEASHTMPILTENSEEFARKTHVFVRGNWLVKGDEVEENLPAILHDTLNKVEGGRLGLAKWLVSGDNPLTARVTVNRFWNKIFGSGIVATLEDFGTQGDLPSHPGLLDWLALKFSEDYKWSIKKLIRQIVMSSTYRQSSVVLPGHLEKDPDNRWLARAPRIRMSAEQIRDQALSVSGLLSDKMYGPSVMPPQPDGLWQQVYIDFKWETSQGEDRYRRALYTFMRRSNPYPSFITFDAATREFCLSRRIRTNTPLQALVTLNDPVYMEAALGLAKFMNAAADDTGQQISAGYYQAIKSSISDDKLAALAKLYKETLPYYENNKEEARKVAGSHDPELAALTIVASALINLDEFLTKS